ncbi:MAG: molybdopterin-dependent oxidoreductase, partial [Proteobacteria bacterium]|nr:molybdopterin-dependent oxidoreductase [Pseudomonadota bacterium]
CIKGQNYQTITHHPTRLTHPLRRTRGGWQRIGWEEALGEIAARFLSIRESSGPESVVLGYGTGRDNESFIYRFANLFGTPNVLTAGHMCYGPRVATGIVRCGNLPVVDYEGRPSVVVAWGANPLVSNPDEYKGFDLADTLKQGAKLVVVDPRRTFLARRADLWLPLRPGTDGALAWGMLNAIIENEWFDGDFVRDYVHGWEAFRERAEEYPLSWASQLTGLDQDLIVEAARLYTQSGPAGIHWGVALEQSSNCIDNISLLISLMAVAGHLDRPGGNVFYPRPPLINASYVGLHRRLTNSAKRLGGDRFRLADMIGVITPRAVWEAILEERPYPVEALFLISTNPVITRANARQVKAALEKVGFLVVADFFMTPTAREADIVLPSSTWLEHDYVADNWKRHGYALARQKAVQVGQARSDYEILNDLGRRCNDPADWWPDMRAALDYMLSPSGLNWDEFCRRGYLKGERVFRKYKREGFSTPTKKVELWSTTLEKMGYDPLPGFRGPAESTFNTPHLMDRHPYTLITGARIPAFFHSENRAPGPLRDRRPDPLVEIHPDLARRKEIAEGDWVRIISPRGACLQRARITDRVPPDVVAADHGWWFPEREEDLGWDRSNINLLTANDFDSCDPAFGATNLRTLLVDIEKAESA